MQSPIATDYADRPRTRRLPYRLAGGHADRPLGLIFIAIGLIPWIFMVAAAMGSDLVGDTFPANVTGRYYFRPPATVEGCLESVASHNTHRWTELLRWVGYMMAVTWPIILFGGTGWWMGTRASFDRQRASERIERGLRRAGMGLVLIGLALGLKAAYAGFAGHLSAQGMRIHSELLAHTITEARLAAFRGASVLAAIFGLPFAMAGAFLLLLARRRAKRLLE